VTAVSRLLHDGSLRFSLEGRQVRASERPGEAQEKQGSVPDLDEGILKVLEGSPQDLGGGRFLLALFMP